MIVGIIPAKSVSNRLKNKNFRKFNGKPMIAWTIEAAIKSKIFDKIIVSTDNIKIKKYIQKYNVDISLRPKKLSGERYGIEEVIEFNIDKHNIKSGVICCMFPCAPLMQSKDIIKGYRKLISSKYNYIFAASNFSHPVEKSFKIINKKIKMVFNNKYSEISSKFFSETYHDVGYFYWARKDTLLKKKWTYNSKSSFVKIPNWRAQDIDTLDDLKKTDLIFKSLKKKK